MNMSAARDEMMEDVVVTLDALPDALLLHTFAYLHPGGQCAVLGRCRRVSSRWCRFASEDALWQPVCALRFGLGEARQPDGTPCASFIAAARVWTDHAESLGLGGDLPVPLLAPLWRQSAGIWDRLSGWTAAHLPHAHETIGPPATSDDWALFVRRLRLSESRSRRIEEPLLSLRTLYAQHNGQCIAHDVREVMRHVQELNTDDDEVTALMH